MELDVITFGEALIDFVSTELGVTLVQASAFKKAPGGAPANVAVGLARLGTRSGFVGKVGDDDFGHFIARVLAENGVDSSAVLFDKGARTALAFVSLKEDMYPKSCTSRYCVNLTSSGKCEIIGITQRRQIWQSDTQRN